MGEKGKPKQNSGQATTTGKIVNRDGRDVLEILYETRGMDELRNSLFALKAMKEMAYMEREVVMMSDLQVKVEYGRTISMDAYKKEEP